MPRRPARRESAEDMLERIAAQLKGAPNADRYRPHAKQSAFHRLESVHRLFLGGNRSGKSVAGTMEGIWRAEGRHPFREVPPAPTRGRVIGTDFAMGIEKVLLPLWKQWVPPRLLINGRWEDSYHDGKDGKVLTLANGSTVEFMSYEQDVQKFAGASRHWIHFDEEPPKDIYDESRARLVDTNGVWWMTLTPVLGLDFIYDEVYRPGMLAQEHPELLPDHLRDSETGLPLFGVVEVESYENTYLKRSALDGFFATLDEQSAKTRREGQFVQVLGAVWPDFDRARHVISGPFYPDLGTHRVYVSIDNGWRDHTAVLWHAVNRDNDVTTFAEVYVNQTTIPDVAKLIKKMNAEIGIERPYLYVGDPTSLRQTSQQTGLTARQAFAREGVGIAVEGVNTDVEFGVQRMTQYLRASRDPGRADGGVDAVVGEAPDGGGPVWGRVPHPKWLVTDNCPNLIRQLEKNRWKRRARAADEQTMNKLREIQQVDNHATDSARFFFVMMPDLQRAGKRVDDDTPRAMADAADMLGAVNPDARRDPKFGTFTSSGWQYRPTTSKPVGEFDGWEE